MLNHKNIKIGIVTLSAMAISTFAFPFVQSNAAAASTSSTMSRVNQMYYSITGKQAPTAKYYNFYTNSGSSSSHTATDNSTSNKYSSSNNTGSTGIKGSTSNTGFGNTDSGNTGSSSNTGSTTDNGSTDQSSNALADKIIATGEKFLGTPYQYGAASGQTQTFDCSSFTQYVFKQNGINLLRSSRQQYTQGTSIPRDQIKKGDLLFFTTSHSGGQIGHVGIYAGNNQILHTWGSKGVQLESMDHAWLKQGYVGAKRVIK
ncbi:NlpC/P60 family protein [Shimazuella sp. AN120528]|uniref:C40 family peptidase n=1 Tax=Shimazuella soli TaxID=1892854 RepID=UPI001F10CA2C|nr:C40 family peptidase [Shimazuella soli]MCH5584327.1 NlpC/P60 family protein [Shimazuella soli]